MEENKKEEKVEEKKANKASVATESKKEEKKEETKKETVKEDKKIDTVKGKVEVKNKKNNNNIFIVIGIIAVIVAIVAIAIAMTVGKNTPKSVVESTLKEIKTGAFAQNMLAGLMQGESTMNAEAEKLLVEKLEWKVIEEKEEGEIATVKVEITNKDFKTVMGNYMQKALKAAFSGNVNEQEMTNYLMEELRNEEIQTVTETNEISLQKKDGKWEIVQDENFVYAVLPGLQEAINAIR